MPDEECVAAQGTPLRCNRRITVARDHSAKQAPPEAKKAQQVAPATPVAASKKKRRAVQAETPSKAIGPDTGVQLELDDILAAEVSWQHATAPYKGLVQSWYVAYLAAQASMALSFKHPVAVGTAVICAHPPVLQKSPLGCA